jgi:YD repeat-containing protein
VRHTRPFTSFLILALLISGASLFGQKVVTQNAGGGRKIELHYDAAGQVVETRTIGADGKVLQTDALEKLPGAFIPNSVSTAYFPNGVVQKVTRNTYDNNSNFTGEFIQIFNQEGKQIGGHRLTHEPHTNVYVCQEWNTGAQSYKTVECPAAEESSGPPEAVKKFTAEEVNQQLMRAREAAKNPQKGPPAPAASPTASGSNVKEIGLVLPRDIRPGERVSGSVVEDPSRYEGMPEIMVTRVALPFAASGPAATLSGWQLEISGEPPQHADGPIALTVPPGQPELAILIRPIERPGVPIPKLVNLGSGSRSKSKPPGSYLAAALCLKGQLCVVRGPFNGDSSKTFAAFEDRPAKIITETSDTLYLAVPDATRPGPRLLAIAESAKAIAFPMVVGEFSIQPDRRDLPKGETLLMYPTLEGPEELPDAEWRAGDFPPSNLDLARKLVPGFEPAGEEERGDHAEHEARERGEKHESKAPNGESEGRESGEILLVLKNLTPDVANFRESRDGMYSFRLHADSFSRGDFVYKFVVEAKQTGNFALESYVIPFLAPIAGQEFPLNPASH